MVHVALPEASIRPLRREEYERLVEAAVFENERLELLYGTLVWKSPQGDRHSFVIQELNELLMSRLMGRAKVRIQSPINAPEQSRPEPDLAVVPVADYRKRAPEKAHLIVEVADSSLGIDRDVKRKLYAQMAVPEYWIVNLVENVVEVYSAPKDGDYGHTQRLGPDGRLKLLAFSDVVLSAADFLPR